MTLMNLHRWSFCYPVFLWGFCKTVFFMVGQCLIFASIALWYWVQPFMSQSRRRITLFCGRVAGFCDGLFHSVSVPSQAFVSVSLDSHPKIYRGCPCHRRLLALVLMCTLHSGEAANPGLQQPSEWTLGVCNPSGLNGKQQIINDHLGLEILG